MDEKDPQLWHLMKAGLFGLIGAAIGTGQVLTERDPPPWHVIVGRAISTGGIAMSAGLALVWLPDLPFLAQLGLASALASLGASGLERLAILVLRRKFGGEK
jgi:hypothetical protein